MKNKNLNKIVIFSEINWNFLRQRHHFLAEYYLNKGYEVIFVQRVISRIPKLREVISLAVNKFRKNINKVYNDPIPGIKLVKSLYLPEKNYLFHLFNLLITKIYYKRICNNCICYFFSPTPVTLLKNIDRKNSIILFDIIHNWWAMPWNTDINKLNADYFSKNSDILITDSLPIMKFVKYKFHKKINLILPGISENWIDSKNNKNIDKPRVDKMKAIFFGNLRGNSDIELLNDMVDCGVEIDIYGILSGGIDKKLNPLIKYLGIVNQDKLKNITLNYDFTLLPYSQDEFSKYIAPAKYYECLSLGKPIISRSDLNHLDGWSDFVFNPYSDCGIINKTKLKDILLDYYNLNKQIQATELAASNSWGSRMIELNEIIYSHVPN